MRGKTQFQGSKFRGESLSLKVQFYADDLLIFFSSLKSFQVCANKLASNLEVPYFNLLHLQTSSFAMQIFGFTTDQNHNLS